MENYGTNPALAVKRAGKWIFWHYKDFYSQAMYFARAMVSMGITPRSCINIIGFNSPEWVLAFVGATFADCVPVGVYATNSVDACRYVAEHSDAKLIIA
jgi:long-chain-fatty-acid--CoA ligase ACSBG